jgi:UMF1 family MFS transporter
LYSLAHETKELSTPLLEEVYHAVLSQSTSKISAFGITLGYLAGIVLLFCMVVPVSPS